MCDVGANVNCRPQHLLQYGIMASVYVQTICGVANPRVGLLSIGEEDAKGTSLVKQTRQLMKDDPAVNFIGNVEGRDLFRGVCDVMVCEGFVGNVVLKLMEGMAEGVVQALLAELSVQAMPGQDEAHPTRPEAPSRPSTTTTSTAARRCWGWTASASSATGPATTAAS